MNALLTLRQHLHTALRADPLHRLALLTVTLDPLWNVDEDAIHEREGDLELALCIARRVFPDLYIEAVLERHHGTNDHQLDTLLCRGFTQRGIPLEDTTWLGYGIPLSAAGVRLEDPDLYHDRRIAAVLALFGVQPEEHDYAVEVPEVVYRAGQRLAHSLLNPSESPWQQVGWLLAWLFGCSGNTLVDLDDEGVSELSPLSWDVDDVAFAVELIAERERILDDAQQGLAWLTETPAALVQLEANVQRVYRSIAQGRQTTQLTWSIPETILAAQ